MKGSAVAADSTGRHSYSRRTQVRKLTPGAEVTLQVSRGWGAALLGTRGWAARRLCSLSPSLHGRGPPTRSREGRWAPFPCWTPGTRSQGPAGLRPKGQGHRS